MEKLTKVEFTNLDKILYPEARVTKAQVIQHYIRMAPRMLGMLKNRPIVLTRFPNGVDKQGFYEKDMPLGTPPLGEDVQEILRNGRAGNKLCCVQRLGHACLACQPRSSGASHDTFQDR